MYRRSTQPIRPVIEKKGLDGIAVTDHNSIKGAVEVVKQAPSEVYIIVGAEIKTTIGEILGLFLNEEISSSNPLEVIDEIRDQGGLIILPHPFRTHVFTRSPLSHNKEIVEQVDRKMVTRWWNHCPTLETCQKLGLDTREICRKAYHKPVQAFLSKIDPRLRFDRNYEALRPHTAYCEEIITLEE